MDDLISRKMAIDAVESVDWYHQNKNGEMVHGANSDEHQAWYKAEDIYHVLDTLPSAQPERDDCDTCKYHGYFGSVVCNNCRMRYPSYWESREGGQE